MTSEFQQELAALKKRIQGNMPPRYVRVLDESTRELERSGIQNGVVKKGAKAPDFELPNQRGEIRTPAQHYRDKPLVITFYRGFWCPYCNADLANLQKFVPEFENAGAALIAISPEKPEYSNKMVRTRKLTFDILTDAGNRVADRFGVKFALGNDLKSLYRDDLNINLKLYHGDDEWALPMPARFVIDTSGIIAYSESSADPTKRPDPVEVVAVLSTL